jgi:hypothetical protein
MQFTRRICGEPAPLPTPILSSFPAMSRGFETSSNSPRRSRATALVFAVAISSMQVTHRSASVEPTSRAVTRDGARQPIRSPDSLRGLAAVRTPCAGRPPLGRRPVRRPTVLETTALRQTSQRSASDRTAYSSACRTGIRRDEGDGASSRLVGLHRRFGIGMGAQRKVSFGRQGKSTDRGRVHMVGLVWVFRHFPN